MSTKSTKPYQIVECPRTTVKSSCETAVGTYIRWKSYDTLRPDRQEDVERYSGWEERNPSTRMNPAAVNSALDRLVSMIYPKKFSYTNKKQRGVKEIKTPELFITRIGQFLELIFLLELFLSFKESSLGKPPPPSTKNSKLLCSIWGKYIFLKCWPFIQPYIWPICSLTQ